MYRQCLLAIVLCCQLSSARFAQSNIHQLVYLPLIQTEPLSGRIVFASNRDGNNEIYLFDTHTNQTQRLTQNTYDDYHADFSPDGAKIAFSSSATRTYNIYEMTLADRSIKQLTTSGSDHNAAYSPDGQWIAFTSNRAGNPDIYVMRSDGTEQKQLTTSTYDDVRPSWSPDGDYLVFESTRNFDIDDPADEGIFNLYTIRPDRTEERRLTTQDSRFASWSHNSNTIAYVAFTSSEGVLHLLDTQTLQDILVPISVPLSGFLDWSLNDRYIVFAAENPTSDLYILDVSTRNIRPLFVAPGIDTNPNWGN